MVGIGEAIFRIATPDYQRRHLITQLPAPHAVANCDHRAGYFQARNIGGTFWWWIEPLTLHHIGPIDAGRCYLDQDLALPGTRYGTLLGHQHLRLTRGADSDHGHVRRQCGHDVSAINKKGGPVYAGAWG